MGRKSSNSDNYKAKEKKNQSIKISIINIIKQQRREEKRSHAAAAFTAGTAIVIIFYLFSLSVLRWFTPRGDNARDKAKKTKTKKTFFGRIQKSSHLEEKT